MTKAEFLQRLAHEIAGLPQADVARWLEYYGEMLDDRMEDGMSEEEAVRAIGTPPQIARQILAETPIARLVKERIKPQAKLPVWVIILLILGSPVWLSLVVAVASVFLSVFAVLWFCVVACWAIELGLAAGALGGVFLCIVQFYHCAPLLALLLLGAALACAGLAIVTLPLWKLLTLLLIKACKGFLLLIKQLFIRKEAAQ